VHALATEAERRGYELTHSPVRHGQYASENRSTFADGQFQMIIEGHETRLRLQEKSGPAGKPVPYHPNKKLALWQTMRPTMLVPTGRLMITIIRDQGEVSGRSSKFADGATAAHMHLNTLRNRVARACELSGLDISDTETRFKLQIVARLRSMNTLGFPEWR